MHGSGVVRSMLFARSAGKETCLVIILSFPASIAELSTARYRASIPRVRGVVAGRQEGIVQILQHDEPMDKALTTMDGPLVPEVTVWPRG
jgi:hypothetical protein